MFSPDELLNPEIVEYLGARGYDFKEKKIGSFLTISNIEVTEAEKKSFVKYNKREGNYVKIEVTERTGGYWMEIPDTGFSYDFEPGSEGAKYIFKKGGEKTVLTVGEPWPDNPEKTFDGRWMDDISTGMPTPPVTGQNYSYVFKNQNYNPRPEIGSDYTFVLGIDTIGYV